MKIVEAMTVAGNAYRIYRSDDNFVADMQKLVPFLVARRFDIEMGGTADDPAVVLTVIAPDAESETAFRELIRRHLAKS